MSRERETAAVVILQAELQNLDRCGKESAREAQQEHTQHTVVAWKTTQCGEWYEGCKKLLAMSLNSGAAKDQQEFWA